VVSADEVQVWLVPDERSDRVLADLLGVLDAGERQRAAAYRSADDRRRFVVAHGAVRHIVAGRTGSAADEIRFVRGPHGKPEVAEPGCCVQVNLSHSGDVAMVAVTAGRRVGVDVQRIVPGLDAVAMARRYFPAEEAEFVRAAADPVARAARFARLWSRKEALVKAHGGRLAQGLRVPVTPPAPPPGSIPAGDTWPAGYRLTDVPAPPGYRAAVALSGLADYRVTPCRWTSPAPPP
jgi:4'-phosphopantetheinyl transferase